MIVLSAGSKSIDEFDYQVGLSRLNEAVISSHFMDAIARDVALQPYNEASFRRRAMTISRTAVDRLLIPTLIEAARAFAEERASVAADRARRHFEAYGLADAGAIGEAEIVTEVLFDRQLSRKSAATCSRRAVRDRIYDRLVNDRKVELVIPALPFKIMSPLKARGAMPDLAEVGFLLSLYEIALTLEAAPIRADPQAEKLSARFVVVSDGSRFASLANVPVETIARYRHALEAWIIRLGMTDHIVVADYRELLEQRLPAEMLAEKRRIASTARRLYLDVLGPAFDPCSMERTLEISREIEPDPENENAGGRFGSLLRSLVYTINYRAIEALELSPPVRYALYRELTASLFDPPEDTALVPGTLMRKEAVRQAMLNEVWHAAIDYMAEIKSDRDLAQDPILTCLPTAIRWTIHAKAGQFAVATPSVWGSMVQAWAGSAVFRLTGKGAVRLCSYPVLGLEGGGAVPVVVSADDAPDPQPLFYIDGKIDVADAETFVVELAHCLTRRRLK
ncbi:MAG: L-tyrosine/L-tryptophan isonitrile synthase family protein [Sphingomonas sp.]